MSMIPIEEKDYSDGRTKQAFKDSTDINKLLFRAQREGTLSHLAKHGAVYADFSDVPDLLEAHRRLQVGERIYRELPSELRREFPDKFKFFAYVNDPANAGDLARVLPELAKPGRQQKVLNAPGIEPPEPAPASTPQPEPEVPPVPST